MPTVPHSRAQLHYLESERILSVLRSLGVDDETATREALTAACHALLAVAAALIERSY